MKPINEHQLGSTVVLPFYQGNTDTDGVFRYRRVEACAELDSVCLFLFAEKESKESRRKLAKYKTMKITTNHNKLCAFTAKQ